MGVVGLDTRAARVCAHARPWQGHIQVATPQWSYDPPGPFWAYIVPPWPFLVAKYAILAAIKKCKWENMC